MTYQEALQRLGETTERSLLSLFGQYRSGMLTHDHFIRLGAQVIDLAHQQGRMVAEVSLLSWLRTVDPEAVPVAAPAHDHYSDVARLERAMQTTVPSPAATAGDDAAAEAARRLGRLAYAESVESSQQAFHEGMLRTALVEGWTRGLEPGACQLCRWWWREGQVWPKEHRMPTHKGCTCTPIPRTRKIQYRVGTLTDPSRT